jgi:hypothetical protein
MSKWMQWTIMVAGMAMIPGYPQQPKATAAMIEDNNTYGDPAVERDPYADDGGEA